MVPANSFLAAFSPFQQSAVLCSVFLVEIWNIYNCKRMLQIPSIYIFYIIFSWMITRWEQQVILWELLEETFYVEFWVSLRKVIVKQSRRKAWIWNLELKDWNLACISWNLEYGDLNFRRWLYGWWTDLKGDTNSWSTSEQNEQIFVARGWLAATVFFVFWGWRPTMKVVDACLSALSYKNRKQKGTCQDGLICNIFYRLLVS